MANRLIIIFLFISHDVYSSACCGGGVGLPNIITGDFKAQYSFNYMNQAITHTANDSGDFLPRDKDNREVRETLVFRGVIQMTDYLQAGLEIPYITNTHQNELESEQYSSLSDPTLQMNYEFLPEISYSPWKPRGFVFVSYTHTIARSVYETKSPLGTDGLGSGFNTLSIGTNFYKVIGANDISFFYKRGFRESNTFSDESIMVEPGYIDSYGVSYGRSYKSLRFGFLANSIFEEARTTNQNGISQKSGTRSYTDFGVNLSFHKNLFSYSLSYIDQTFWGSGKNLNLGKGFSLGMTKFFEL